MPQELRPRRGGLGAGLMVGVIRWPVQYGMSWCKATGVGPSVKMLGGLHSAGRRRTDTSGRCAVISYARAKALFHDLTQLVKGRYLRLVLRSGDRQNESGTLSDPAYQKHVRQDIMSGMAAQKACRSESVCTRRDVHGITWRRTEICYGYTDLKQRHGSPAQDGPVHALNLSKTLTQRGTTRTFRVRLLHRRGS